MSDLPTTINDLPRVEHGPGAVLLKQGGSSGELYFLLRGRVEVEKDGELITVVSQPGAVFGEMSYLLGAPHTATVRVKEQAEFAVAQDPAGFFHSSPGAALYVAQILARRLDALNRYLVDLKTQFKDRDDHLGMVDEVLDALMTKHPRVIDRPYQEGP